MYTCVQAPQPIYLAKTKSINIKNILKSAAILGIVLYFFGVIGNIRQTQTKTEKTYFLRIAGATDKFLESGVPQEFYWSYIYLISPIGNLQNIVDHKADVFDTKNIGFFTATELLPDFISKRVSSIFDYDEIIKKDLIDRPRAAVRPHIRRGHLHGYWVGKRGSAKFILKWVAATIVGV